MNILLKNIHAITCDGNHEVLYNTNIGISDGNIVFVSDQEKDIRQFQADRIINGKDKLAMPGLVNAHTHCSMTLLRNFANDLALHDWLYNHVFPAEAKLDQEDIYWGAMLGIAEMIRTGTTTFADMYLFMDGVAQAVCQTGIRADLSFSPLKFVVGKPIDETHLCRTYHRDWNDKADGRIKVSVEIHSAYLYDEQSLKNAAALAKELKTGIQIHILETERERVETIEKYGITPVELCDRCGIFDVPVIAAHCVHLSDSDMALIKSKNVSVVHNPTSNLKLGSGIARIPEMLERGINVALGTDGAASNNNLDMFDEINLAALIHKGANMNPILINADEAVRMATVNGAKAIGYEDRLGTIKQGMKADLILLDIDQPHFYPLNDPIAAVAYAAHGLDVDTVIVDGNILMEGKELKIMDLDLVKHKVKEISKRITNES
ncbi:MAG: amidohydrolase [Clostridia bacterium]|nr:amidohydrolase [Clostridia bacterium]